LRLLLQQQASSAPARCVARVVSTRQLANAWVNNNPRVSTVILGASKLSQLRENLGALALSKKLTPELLARVDAISKPLAG
jgi:aryl-alcohol dehydrogenase-like predicted oxidoreductase